MATEVIIQVNDPVEAIIKKGADLIRPCLSFDSETYQQGQYRKIRSVKKQALIYKGGVIYTGLIPRIEKFCEDRRILCTVKYSKECESIDSEVKAWNLPYVPSITLRPEQLRLATSAIEGRRGMLTAPMGLGKTIIAMAIMNCFPYEKILFTVPRLSILTKTIKDFKKHGFTNVQQIGDGEKNIGGRIVVATLQTLKTLDLVKLGTYFDVVIADEVHLMTKQMATLENVFKMILAPVRIGVTATLPSDMEKQLIMEGLFGTVLDSVSFEKARELDILAKISLKLIPIPINSTLKSLAKNLSYRKLYKEAIIENKLRNRLLMQCLEESLADKRATIIFCGDDKDLGHGRAIHEMIDEAGIESRFVHGGIASNVREKIVDEVERGQIDCIITNKTWREGVNIKRIGAVIFAAGGKGEEAIPQAIGRGMRKNEFHEDVIVYDFLDPYSNLAEHTVARIGIYSRLGWL